MFLLEPSTYGEAELQGIIPYWPKSWVVQFTVKILRDSPEEWIGITQFCHAELTLNYGCRQPNVAYNTKLKQIEVTLFHDKTNTADSNRIIKYSEKVDLNTRYDIKLEVVLVSGIYYFQGVINRLLIFNRVEAANPDVFENLHYHYGNLWGSAQNTIEISNLLYGGIED